MKKSPHEIVQRTRGRDNAGSPINTSLLTNFLAGGGNDVFGGSVRADNGWKRRAANDAVFEMRRVAA